MAAALAVAAVVVTAAVLAAAVDVPAAAVVVVTAVAVAVAATKQLFDWGRVPQSIKGLWALFLWAGRIGHQTLVARRLRGRPDKTLSYSAFGKIRNTLATQSICQGITR